MPMPVANDSNLARAVARTQEPSDQSREPRAASPGSAFHLGDRGQSPRGCDSTGATAPAGYGGAAPARLDTHRETLSQRATQGGVSPPPEQEGDRNGRPARGRVQLRHRWARPRMQGEPSWRDEVSNELRALGEAAWATSFAACGRWVWAWDCGGCGADDGAARRPLTCGLRGCPSCARVEAKRKVARMADATARVPEIVASRVVAHEAQMSADVLRHQERRDYLRECAQKHRDKLLDRQVRRAAKAPAREARIAKLQARIAECDRRMLSALEHDDEDRYIYWSYQRVSPYAKWYRLVAGANGHVRADEEHARIALESDEGAEQQERERRRARRHLAQTQTFARDGFGWKLVTISPRWRPTSEDELSVAGLGRRLDDVTARVARVWHEVLSVGGLAAATSSVELSDGGHVHAHVLYYGPYLVKKHLTKVAGCHVDVRSVEPHEKGDAAWSWESRDGAFRAGDTVRDAVVEAVKYCVKLPSETHAWLSGEARRVIHPSLVARWMVACRSRQLVRHYGVMLDALAESVSKKPEAEDEATSVQEAQIVPCRHCGREIDLGANPPRRVRLTSWLTRGADVWRATSAMRVKRQL
jgi:hypothetical protein